MSDTGIDAATSSAEQSELDALRAENERLQSRLETRAGLRRWATVALVVLTSLSVVVATVTVWVHETIFDTDQFMETVGPALEDPSFYVALSDTLSAQVLEALDLDTVVTERLAALEEYVSMALVDALGVDARARTVLSAFDRPSVAALAPGITAALEGLVVDAVDRFINSEVFRALLPGLIRRAHEAAVALARGDVADFPNVSIDDGVVRLNLLPVIADALRPVAEDLRGFLPDFTVPDIVSGRVDEATQQFAEAFAVELPDDFGQVALPTEETLGELQTAADRFDRLTWALVVLMAVLLIATIVVSTNRRRSVLQLGLGSIAGLVIALLIARRAERAIRDAITNPDGELAVRAILDSVRDSLQATVVVVTASVVIVTIIAYVAGRPPWLERAIAAASDRYEPGTDGGELSRWVAARYDPLRIAGSVVALVALFVVGLGLVSVLVLGLLLAAYLWALWELRRRSEAALAPPPRLTADKEVEPTS